MYGAAYLAIAFFFGLSAGAIGKIKGSSFWIWFLIGFVSFGGWAACMRSSIGYRPRTRELKAPAPATTKISVSSSRWRPRDFRAAL